MINLQESWLEYPDNRSLAVIWYMTGCLHNCKNCSNPELQQFVKYDDNWLELIDNYMERCRTDKLVLCGGDPLYPSNIPYTKKILELNKYKVCIYTGSLFSHIPVDILKLNWSYIKCGTYDYRHARTSKKTENQLILASPNQIMYRNNNGVSEIISSNGIVTIKDE